MSKIRTTIWEIEPHTEAKHAILRKYLDAWLPIITRYNERVLYIDGFAGPGEYEGEKDGSPVIAVKAVLEHRANIASQIAMLFVEKDRARADFLQNKLASMRIPENIKYKVKCGEFAPQLSDLLDRLEAQDSRLAPAFVLIDPFGFTGIPFELIQRLMRNDKCEVLITFMYEEINRFIGDRKLWPSLEVTFGTDKWKQVIGMKDPAVRDAALRGIYQEQLEEAAGIEFVRSFKMRNRANRTDYFLFFGTNNLTGLKKMKEAMWRTDQSGAFQFSDATDNPDQAVLFELGPDYNKLKTALVENFRGRTVTVKEIEYFVVTQTPFRETHYKRAVLAKMESSEHPEIQVHDDGKRRRGSFPEHCRIEFL